MTLQYKLSVADKAIRGVLINTTPLILDSNQDCEIFFYMSNGKTLTSDYYVTLTDSFGQETRLQIVDSKVNLPKKHWREQELKVSVDYVSGGKLVKTWYCQPLRLAFKDNLDKATLTIGLDLFGLSDRIASLENELAAVQVELVAQSAQIVDLTERVNKIETASSELSESLEE